MFDAAFFCEIFFIPTWMVQNVSIKKSSVFKFLQPFSTISVNFHKVLPAWLRTSHDFPIPSQYLSECSPVDFHWTCWEPVESQDLRTMLPYPVDVAEKYLENPPFSSMIFPAKKLPLSSWISHLFLWLFPYFPMVFPGFFPVNRGHVIVARAMEASNCYFGFLLAGDESLAEALRVRATQRSLLFNWDMMGIWWEYDGNMMGIWWEYDGNVRGVS